MENGINKLIVSNTFTEEWEMEYYVNLANELNYRVISLIVENRHSNKSVHDVPQETINRMNNRFDIKL
jgi:phenolic acid decarboxylase